MPNELNNPVLQLKTVRIECLNNSKPKIVGAGVVTLPEFLVPSAISSAISDIDASQAWVTDTEHNIYLDGGSDHGNDQNSSISLGVDHVRNRKLHTKVYFIQYRSYSTANFQQDHPLS